MRALVRSILTLTVLAVAGCSNGDGHGPRAPSTACTADTACVPPYQLRYTGRPGDPPTIVRRAVLLSAARLARDKGHTRFAILGERIERIPTGGALEAIRVVARVRPFTDDPPPGTTAVYAVEEFLP